MNKHFLTLVSFFAAATYSFADIDITNLYLQNAGFDDEAHFDYRKGESGNVAQEILPVFGWDKDINVDYTITGVYEYGTGKTFNTYGKIPPSGYNNSKGGCLALSTGWGESMKFYQNITLPVGKYKLQTVFYNGSNSQNGYSELAWIPETGSAAKSSLSSFPQNQWKVDEVSFTLNGETSGRVQIGFRAVENGSANSAKVVADYVKIFLVGNDDALLSEMKSTLLSTISDAEKLYADGKGNKAAQLKNVIDRAKEILEVSSSYEALFNQNSLLAQEIETYKWANSTKENKLSFTKYIANPSFENDLNGWTQQGLKTQTNTSFAKKSGNTYVEKWVSNGSTVGSVSLSQIVSELPMGHYSLTVSAQNLQDGKDAKGAYIFAGNDTIEVSSAKDYTLDFILMEESLCIGFFTKEVTGNWVALDNFRLYYYAATIEEFKAEIEKRIGSVNEMLKRKMYDGHRRNLVSAQSQAEEWLKNPAEERLANVSATLNNAMQTAQTSAAAFDMLSVAINEAKVLVKENGKGSDKLSEAVKIAEGIYADESQTISDVSAATNELNAAVLMYKTENSSGESPVVETDMRYARGATIAFARASYKGSNIIESGFCYSSTSANPTVLDSRSTKFYQNNGNIYVIEDLNPATFYYIRPYAISKSYAVGYGKAIKICTLPKGTITWQYNNGGSDEENARISAATADAVDIWNNITSISGLHITVNYGAQTQTADCSYGGWMRVGPNASYQRTGTIQHEMCHAAGVGTTNRWYNDATYRAETSKGFWLGERTDKVLQFLENDANAHLKGDNTHFWPYGVNGAHEDDGTRMLYYANALIIQALGEDNLPPTSGAFASPAYTFTQEDNEYYYLLPENLANGNTALLNGGVNSSPSLVNCDWKKALTDHAFAWQIRFNPTTQLYELRNVATEKSLSNSGSYPSLSEKQAYTVQLLGSRENVSTKDFNMKSYWMVFADGTDQPLSLTSNNLNLSAAKFDHKNSATSQRWIILSRPELKALAGDFTEIKDINSCSSAFNIYSVKGGIEIETNSGEWIMISDMFGRTIKSFYMQANVRISVQLSKGIYIVNDRKVVVR